MELSDADLAMLDGVDGDGVSLAMRVIVRLAEAADAARLLDITGAHIDSCLYHGRAGVDFAAALVDGGARVRVPTTLNVGSLDLLHPDLYRGDAESGAAARRLMSLYEALGCRPTWTCAPYQRLDRPAQGQHVAWAESNAIVFANSVLGARTARYGDFVDICAAVTGRAPACGLHLDEHRRATLVIDAGPVADRLADKVGPALLGHVIGRRAGTSVAAVVGAPHLDEDQLKTLGAAAASSGAVALVHIVGSTPEAPSLAAVVDDPSSVPRITIESADLRAAWRELSTVDEGRIGAVSLGTPHYSVAEFAELVRVIDDLGGAAFAVPFYVSTSRAVLAEIDIRGWLEPLEAQGVQLVTDTCTYITPVMAPFDGPAMTDSPKWAYYAPGNLGIDVVFATVDDCVRSAVAGRVVRTESSWP